MLERFVRWVAGESGLSLKSRAWEPWIGAVIVTAMALLAGGCSTEGAPRYRVGSLPFPGPFTLYAVADPRELGHHAYDEPPLLAGDAEIERGTIYTRRAGFLDLSHVRDTADWTRFFHERIEPALLKRDPTLVIRGADAGDYAWQFRYPPDWDSLDDVDRRALARELSIRIAQRSAHDMANWHEIISWFGYKTVVIIPEDNSAFTCDDVIAHFVGIAIAGEALRDESHPYDQAMTAALDRAMTCYGAVSPQETSQAVRLVKGKWWRGITAIKRQLELGDEDQPVEAWLVPGASLGGDGGDVEPASFTLPSLRHVLGRDMTGFYDLAIDPHILEWSQIAALLSPQPDRIHPREHFPVIMEHVRQQMRQTLGPNVDQPYDQARTASRNE
ncbi:MAG: DUF4056 domain-containing protein [Phycisphaeraceae bacterium]